MTPKGHPNYQNDTQNDPKWAPNRKNMPPGNDQQKGMDLERQKSDLKVLDFSKTLCFASVNASPGYVTRAGDARAFAMPGGTRRACYSEDSAGT